eukprot:TRINITY_DN822_c0_g2_i1.p1 TRINITY_DN822_c0_g2~~TRINITY_DN822_c0_g2_i1.p1  ORF type:complete len:725 (-),score=189.64 TRINITY_DN822_c0_g2_i1:946-3120(-)
MFTVELAGYGIVRDVGFAPYPVFVISVQQPMQSWTCYRRYSSFKSLSDHLSNGVRSALPQCPHMTDDSLMSSADQLDGARVQLQAWLHQALLIPGVKESKVLQNFLCANANMPPPRLDITWASNYCPSLDEMEMDELFDRHLEEKEGEGNEYARDGSDAGSDNDEPGGLGRENGYSYEGPSDMEFGTSAASGGAGMHHHQQHSRGGGGAAGNGNGDRHSGGTARGDGYAHDTDGQHYDSTLDMPSEDDIASSVPVEITFITRGGQGAFGSATTNAHFAQGAAALGDGVSPQDQPAAGNMSAQQPAPASGLMKMPWLMSAAATGAAAGAGDAPPNFNSNFKPRVGLDNFKIIKVIGKGSFGKVFLVRDKLGGEIFAMKVLRKDNIIKRNQVEHTKTERNVLGYVRHPFIVGLNMAFQTREKLFFVLDYCAGGELFFHLGKLGKFPEDRSKFYAAEIALALEHVHKLDIVYRDLKPENVLLDGEGHIRLTDFGLSKEGITNNTSGAHSFCGTPEYLAPEILNRQGHGRAVDWWSLGALLYEMLTGLPPFYCRDREKLFDKIRRAQLTYPRYLSESCQDILHGLLTRDPSLRLGSSTEDASEVKRHVFFSTIDWEKMFRRELRAPWQPTVVGSVDTSQFDMEFTSMPIFSPSDREFKVATPSGQPPGHHMADRHAHAASNLSQSHGDHTFEGFTFVDRSSVLLANQPPSHQPLRPRTMVDFMEGKDA